MANEQTTSHTYVENRLAEEIAGVKEHAAEQAAAAVAAHNVDADAHASMFAKVSHAATHAVGGTDQITAASIGAQAEISAKGVLVGEGGGTIRAADAGEELAITAARAKDATAAEVAQTAAYANAAGTATKADAATKDGAGNVITTVYATKTDVATKQTMITASGVLVGDGAGNVTAATSETYYPGVAQQAMDSARAVNDQNDNNIADTYATKAKMTELEQSVAEKQEAISAFGVLVGVGGGGVVEADESTAFPGTAAKADVATKDGAGNVIATTYATKTEVDAKQDGITASGVLVGDGAGGVTAADADTAFPGTAAKATADADGNDIKNTYATKDDVAAKEDRITADGPLVRNNEVIRAADATDTWPGTADNAYKMGQGGTWVQLIQSGERFPVKVGGPTPYTLVGGFASVGGVTPTVDQDTGLADVSTLFSSDNTSLTATIAAKAKIADASVANGKLTVTKQDGTSFDFSGGTQIKQDEEGNFYYDVETEE